MTKSFAGSSALEMGEPAFWGLGEMHHAFSAFVMILSGLLFTSCTATLVQQWATSRPTAAASAEYAAPPSVWEEQQRQGLVPARASPSEECKPASANEQKTNEQKAPPIVPKFSPLRHGPKS